MKYNEPQTTDNKQIVIANLAPLRETFWTTKYTEKTQRARRTDWNVIGHWLLVAGYWSSIAIGICYWLLVIGNYGRFYLKPDFELVRNFFAIRLRSSREPFSPQSTQRRH